MSEEQHAMLIWASMGLGWSPKNAIQAEGVTHFIFEGNPEPVVSIRVSPVYWSLAGTREDRLRVALETVIDTQRICLTGGFDPRNPPGSNQEEQDVQDGNARYDEMQQDEGRSDPDAEGAPVIRG